MRATPTLTRPHGIAMAVAAGLSSMIAIGIVASVTDLFQSRGAPMAQLAAAERACAGKTYVSERQACMRVWIASSQGTRMANR